MIRLRALEPDDATFMYQVENDMTVAANSCYAAPLSMEMLTQYALNYDADPFSAGQLRLVAVTDCNVTDCDEAVGLVDFTEISARDRTATVGIMLLPQHRNKGLGTAMLSAAVKYAFSTIGLHSLIATIQSDNAPSLSAFKKCGFQIAGTLHDWHFSNGRLHDVVIMQSVSTNS